MTEIEPVQLADPDDPRVTAFRALLARTDRWNKRNSIEGSYAEAGDIVAFLRDITIAAGITDAFWHRIHADARDCGNDDRPVTDEIAQKKYVEAAERGLLRAAARALLDFGSAMMPAELRNILVADLLKTSTGEAPIIAERISRSERQQDHRSILDDAKRRSILMAHHAAGLSNTKWMDQHILIFPIIGREGTENDARTSRKRWNKLAPQSERKLARSAGRKEKKGEKLTDKEKAVVDAFSQCSAKDLLELIIRASRNDWP